MAETRLTFGLYGRDRLSPIFRQVGLSAGKLKRDLVAVSAVAVLPGGPALAAGAGALTAAFSSAGLAVGAFGVAVAPQAKLMAENSKAATKLATAQETAARKIALAKELEAKGHDLADKAGKAANTARLAALDAEKAYLRQTKNLPPATAEAALSLARLKVANDDYSKSLASTTMPVFTKALDLARKMLPGLTPMVGAASAAFSEFFTELDEGVENGGFGKFMGRLAVSARVTLPALLSTGRNVFSGLGGIIKAFLPTGESFAVGMEKGSAAFAKWGQGLEKSKGFEKFIAYVKTNGPPLVDTIVSLGTAVVHVAVAMAPLAGSATILLGTFAKLIAGTPEPVLRALAIALVAARVAMVAYSVGAGIATAATWLFGTSVTTTSGMVFASRIHLIVYRTVLISLAVAHGVVTVAMYAFAVAQLAVVAAVRGTIVAVRALGVALIFLTTNPVGLIITAIALLAVGLVLAYKKSETFRKIVHGALEAVGKVGKWLWDNALKPAFGSFKVGMLQLGEGAIFLVKLWLFQTRWMLKIWLEVVGGIVHGAAKALGWVPGVGGKLKKADDAFRKFKDSTVKKFDKIREKVDATQKKISGMKGKSIDVKVSGKYQSLDYSAKIRTLPVATGGQVLGPGTGTSDDIPAMLSNREWVIRAAAAGKLGNKVMSIINQADRLGLDGQGLSQLLQAKGYATGGQVLHAQKFVRAADPHPYIWGGVGPYGWDCSGLTGSVYGILTGRNPYRRYFTTRSNFGALGFDRGYGLYTIGVNDSHMVGNIAGLPFEAASSRSGIKVGSSAAKVGSFPKIYHLGPRGNWGNGGGWSPPGWMINGVMRAAGPVALEAVRKDLAWPRRGSARLYDAGGWLPQGDSLVRNTTSYREPAAVFTREQWQTLQQLADGATGGVFTGDLYLDSGEFLGVVRGEIKRASERDEFRRRGGRR